jgi:hypothetical protein
MPTSEEAKVVRIVCCDDPTAEADRRGHSESVNRQLASDTGIGEEVPGDPCNPGPGGHNLGNPRPSNTSIGSSAPCPRYNSTSTAEGIRTGAFRRWALRIAARTRW